MSKETYNWTDTTPLSEVEKLLGYELPSAEDLRRLNSRTYEEQHAMEMQTLAIRFMEAL